MERLASAKATTSYGYVSWEEVFGSGGDNKARKEVRYFLKRRDGSSDLAVVGREKSTRHMSYHYAIRDEVLARIGSSSLSLLKLKSHRDVIDWLNSIVSDSQHVDASGVRERKDGSGPDAETMKDNQLRKPGHSTKEFSWLGSPWTCRKRRKHYQSFRWNGFKISVYDFVYVLAEEDKRLVAYLEDMYEDSRGNKMVMVRWFHKIDEVGIVLPRSFSDREIFFSLCLQDLSVECIDGLATVLSPQHYEKFQNEARHTKLEPFVCDNQFDNDDVKHFDITQVKGYWKQEILRYMYTLSDPKSNGSSQQSDDSPTLEEDVQFTSGVRPKKRLRGAKVDGGGAAVELENLNNSRNETKSKNEYDSLKQVGSTASKETKENALWYLAIGSQVEVLSQDSGIRGCWFRASVIKKHKNKVKVQYQDIQDAADEAKKLEEWVLASGIAAHDHLNLWLNGRTKIRPAPQSSQSKVSGVVNVGSIVDVWWHDGWWEGIIVQNESEAKCHVYFPGEKLVSTFSLVDLRPAQEWTGNRWLPVRERPDLVSSILSSLKTPDPNKSAAVASAGDGMQSKQGDTTSLNSERENKSRKPELVPDLSKDDLLSQLRWKSSRKRRRSSAGSCRNSNCRKSPDASEPHASDGFMISASLKVIDHDDCKYSRGDPAIFNSTVVPSLTNLVMCR